MDSTVLPICPDCGERSFEVDRCGAEATKTCTNCGYTCNNVVLEPPDRSDVGYTLSGSVSLNKKYKISLDKDGIDQRKLAAIRQMKAYLDNYPRGLCLHNLAEALFLQSLKGLFIQKLCTFGAATVVIVLREAGQSVFLRDVASFFRVTTKDLIRKMRYIKSTYRDSTLVAPIPIEHFVIKYLNSSSGIDDVDKVQKLALSVCDLIEKVRLGSSPDTIAVLGIYFAVIALNGKVPAIGKSEFFKNFSMAAPFSGFSNTIVLFREKLSILAKRLPWGGKVNKRNVHIYIDSIIKYQSLIFEEEPVDGAAVECENTDMLPVHSNTIEKDNASGSNVVTEQMKLELPCITIKQMLNPKPVEVEKPDPPPVSSSEVLVENDCPIEELHEYLRTDEEINVYLKIKALTGGDK